MGKDDDNKYDPLMSQLQPIINTQSRISEKAADAGLENVATARKEYDYVSQYLKTLFEGNDDQLLKLLDSGEATRNIDENEQLSSSLGVRGGRRAAELGASSSNRDAALSRVLQQLRFAAPDKMAQIAQAVGNLGLGQLSASTGAGAQASNNLFGVEGLKQADEDRRAALLGSIFETVGSLAGVATSTFCLSLNNNPLISVPAGKIRLSEIKEGDLVTSFDIKTKTRTIRKVIRIRESEEELEVLSIDEGKIEATSDHVFYNKDFEEILAPDMNVTGSSKSRVKIIKLDDEERNYVFIAAGYWCADDNVMG